MTLPVMRSVGETGFSPGGRILRSLSLASKLKLRPWDVRLLLMSVVLSTVTHVKKQPAGLLHIFLQIVCCSPCLFQGPVFS